MWQDIRDWPGHTLATTHCPLDTSFSSRLPSTTSEQDFKPEVLHCTVDALTLLFGTIGLALGVPVAGSIHTDVDKIMRSFKAAEWAIKSGWALEAAESRLVDACATTSKSYKEVFPLVCPP